MRLYLLADVAADALDEHIQRDKIVATLQHDDIRPALAGLHILLVHRLYRGEVLLHHRFQRAAALPYIPQDAAQDALIGIGIHKDFVISISLASSSSAKMRMPSTMMTLVG